MAEELKGQQAELVVSLKLWQSQGVRASPQAGAAPHPSAWAAVAPCPRAAASPEPLQGCSGHRVMPVLAGNKDSGTSSSFRVTETLGRHWALILHGNKSRGEQISSH